ncbi:class D beta-lactamase [Ectopseudomonas mendocina]|uniref:Beta-lactamase n=1 Tax=Ectopseudomonas mendocina TaxID=300 RepID=A0ABZ2RG89_ECTME
MKRIALVLMLVLTAQVQAQPTEWLENPAVGTLFQQAGIDGTFVLHEVGSDKVEGYNQARAQTRFYPASTFKIPNSLIGLSTGAVSSVDEVIPWDGKPKFLKSWERAMGLREAITVSNYPIYQELARRVGLKRMTAQLAALNYGNGQVGEQVNTFWVEGPLTISAIEQTEFLERLVQDKLPFTPEIQEAVREITLLEEGPNWRLYGKTGWSKAIKPGVGWWVGWVEQDGRYYTFALNMPMDDLKDASKRVELGKASLRKLGLI